MMFQVIRPNRYPGRIRLAVFDFDGTVSLLRSGWQQLMVELAMEVVPRLDGENDTEISAIARDLVFRTTGQPAIHQMQAVADLVRARGGTPMEAMSYKRLCLARLSSRVGPRLAAIKMHPEERETWLVPGVLRMLETMHAREVECYLASGSDEVSVRAETAALGIDRFFAGIYGATSNVENSTKAVIIPRIAREHDLGENEWVTFGDGVEEIRLANESGGIAVGIAWSEFHSGLVDPDQCTRLVAAGADVIIKDFRSHDQVISYLFAPAV